MALLEQLEVLLWRYNKRVDKYMRGCFGHESRHRKGQIPN